MGLLTGIEKEVEASASFDVRRLIGRRFFGESSRSGREFYGKNDGIEILVNEHAQLPCYVASTEYNAFSSEKNENGVCHAYATHPGAECLLPHAGLGIRHSYAASPGAESLLPNGSVRIPHSYAASPGAESLLPNGGLLHSYAASPGADSLLPDGGGRIPHSHAVSPGAKALLPNEGGIRNPDIVRAEWPSGGRIRHSYAASPGAESLWPNEGGPGKDGNGIGALHNSCVAVRSSDAIEGKSCALATGDGGGLGAAISAKPDHNTEVTVSNRFKGVTY